MENPLRAMPLESESDGQCPTSSTIHFLPCSIDYDGTAPIKSFFQTTSDADGNLTSHLRGRKLKGKSVELNIPQERECKNSLNLQAEDVSTVTGLCVGDNGNRNWIVEGHFSSMNVWEHDTSPDLSVVDECLSWFMIADQVGFTSV
jgi:Ribonuclease H2 non-catalytic subunit (Ylr154p-like)